MSRLNWKWGRRHLSRNRVRVAAAILLLILIGAHVYLLRYTLLQFKEVDGYMADLFHWEGLILKVKSQTDTMDVQAVEKEIGRHIVNGYGNLGKYLEAIKTLADDAEMEMEYELRGLQHPPEAPQNVHQLPIRIAFTANPLSLSSSLSFTKKLLEACPVPAYLSGFRSVGNGNHIVKTEILIEVWIRVPL